MIIRFTQTIEHVIDIDDDDTVAINEVDAILRECGMEGDDIGDRLNSLYIGDDGDALSALARLADIEDETWVCDNYDAPEEEDALESVADPIPA